MTRKISLLLALGAPALVLALSFTVENIDSYGVDKPAVCVDDSGHPYVLGNSHGGNDVVKFIHKAGGPWLLDSISFSLETGINYNCRVAAALSADRHLHVLYRVRGGTYGWPVYATNAGGNFTAADTLTHNTGESTYEYGIALDSQNRAHIVCDMNGGVRYYYPYTDSQLVIAANAMDPSIAVGKNNVVHVAFASPATNSKIYYVNNAAGSFGTPQLVSDSLGIDPSLCVDTAGHAYISWTQTNGWAASDLFYADNRTGAFQARKVAATPAVNEAWSQITRSRTDDIGIAYNLWLTSNTSKIMFACKPNNDTSFTIDTVSAGHWNQSYGSITWNDRAAAIDPAGYVHLAYAGASGTEYARSQTPVGLSEARIIRAERGGLGLTVTPNPFRNTIKIGIRLSVQNPGGAEGLAMKIYNAAGRMVRDLSSIASRTSIIIWDGKDTEGQKVPAGVYLLKVALRAGRDANTTTGTAVLIRIE